MPETKHCPKCGARVTANAPAGLCPRCLMRAAIDTQQQLKSESPHKGLSFTPPSIEELSGRFDDIEILELIGQGGMGAVYKAQQVSLDRLVAVKILPPEVGAESDFAERFSREARALAKLNHPNIVHVYDFGQTADHYYFVMEYVDGLSLRQTLRAGDLNATEALAIVPQICDALQFAHDEGIVHRDIKPENIIFNQRGQVKIADFGLAKLTGADFTESLTGTYQAMGTPNYVAPEQIERPQEVDHRADIYSLGVVFYEMLTGELPIGRFLAPSEKVHIDVRLDEVVLRSLAKEPERRYQSANDVKAEVEHVSGDRINDLAASIDHQSDLSAGMAVMDARSNELQRKLDEAFASPTAQRMKRLVYVCWNVILLALSGSLLYAVQWQTAERAAAFPAWLLALFGVVLLLWSCSGLYLWWRDTRAARTDHNELPAMNVRLARHGAKIAGGVVLTIGLLFFAESSLIWWFVISLTMAMMFAGGGGLVNDLDRKRQEIGRSRMWDDSKWTALDTGLVCYGAFGLAILILNPFVGGMQPYHRVNIASVGVMFWLGHLIPIVMRVGRRHKMASELDSQAAVKSGAAPSR